jgi:hypothetical protein
MGTWANYRVRLPMKIEEIDTQHCTHLNYGFAKLDPNNYTIVPFDPWLDIELSEFQVVRNSFVGKKI